MFTGIITDIGIVTKAAKHGQDKSICVASSYDYATLRIGTSIAVQGICLTLTQKKKDGKGTVLSFDLSPQTMSCTTSGDWREGTRVNLERTLSIGDELGGHFVTGHVDCAVTVAKKTVTGDCCDFEIAFPTGLAPFIAPHGSVTLDGVALTVTRVEGSRFGVTLIPHTLTATTWMDIKEGDRLNLEVDMMARYVKRLVHSK